MKSPISVQEASRIIGLHLCTMPDEMVDFTQSAGRVLSEPIVADRPFPPFDRVMMDGICIRFADWQKGIRQFRIVGRQLAGEPPLLLDVEGTCIEIMTGAPISVGADTVIRYEDIGIANDGHSPVASILVSELVRGQSVHICGSDRKAGEVLVEAGVRLSAAEMAVAAAVGKIGLRVKSRPNIALISTGDELVPPDQMPLPHQVRRSNTFALATALAEWPVRTEQFHLPDDQQVLEQQLGEILLSNDVLVLSGGISAGKADYIPEVLSNLGVNCLFHGVAQRPGKPFWFGQTDNGKTVFALPGNPVSTFMCAHRYLIPWLASSLGVPQMPIWAKLEEDFVFKPSLTYFLQVKSRQDTNGQIWCKPVTGNGSGDFANLLEADAFLELPSDRTSFQYGEAFPLIPYRRIFGM